MADSAFWRDLAVQFSALRDKRKLRAGGANDSMFTSALETLAMRGASEIAVAGTSDLLHIWLEELRKQGLPFQSSGQCDEVLSEAELGERIYRGFTDGLCEASVTFCNRREAQAVQAEFEEKQRNNPRNWSQFRQQYEALKSVRELRSEPPEQISEQFARQAIARIRGIKPEDVTREQIAFEVAGLFSSTRRHIELIPSMIKPGSPPEPEANPGYVGIAISSDTSDSGIRSQTQVPPIHSAVPLSHFEATVGKLILEARRMCPAKYLPRTEILGIAALLDDKGFPVRQNLEREAARAMAEYNQRHPMAAIKSWKTAAGHPQFRRAVRKRFTRAEEKYKKTTPSIANPSAGTSRTTI
jgi:hypothetical protein